MVGPKAASSADLVEEALASTLLAGKGDAKRKTANATVAATPTKAIKIHVERRSIEYFTAVCTLVRFFFFMRVLAPPQIRLR
jgi:ribosomal protein S9